MKPASAAAKERGVLKPETDIVAAHVDSLRQVLRQQIEQGTRLLSLDLSLVQMVDSTGIGLLISAHNSMRKAGGTLELTHVSPEVLELFRAMRMHQHFRISGNE